VAVLGKGPFHKEISLAVIFLDRDGVLNVEETGTYINSPDQLQVFDFAPLALATLRLLGHRCFLVTNQAGVGMGYLTPETLNAIHDKLCLSIGEFDGIYTCMHSKDAGCDCRKPKPGLLLQAAKEHGIDLGESYFVGDRPSDIEAAYNAGCVSVAVLSGHLTRESIGELPHQPDMIFDNVLAFAEYLIK